MNRDYSALDREALERRLEAAEDALVLWSWCPSRSDETDRDAAAHELWLRWCALPGASSDVKDNPHLTDELIARLADDRAITRAITLHKFTEAGLLPLPPGEPS